LFLGLALGHFLRGSPPGFLLGMHLLFNGTACGFFLLVLHGGGLGLLSACGLIGRHAFGSGTLLLGSLRLLLLHRGCFSKLACFFGSLGRYALLLDGGFGLLLHQSGLHAGFICLSACLSFLLLSLLLGGGFDQSASSFRLGSSLLCRHALLLGGTRLLLCNGGLQASSFCLSSRCGLLSSPCV
jgi:hypothetical protein